MACAAQLISRPCDSEMPDAEIGVLLFFQEATARLQTQIYSGFGKGLGEDPIAIPCMAVFQKCYTSGLISTGFFPPRVRWLSYKWGVPRLNLNTFVYV